MSQKITSKILHFFNQSELRKRSIEKFPIGCKILAMSEAWKPMLTLLVSEVEGDEHWQKMQMD